MSRTAIIRTDVSSRIGMGHLCRSTVLAKELVHQGCRARLVCRAEGFPIPSSMLETYSSVDILPWDISTADDIYFLTELTKKMDGAFLVIDHNAADSEYQRHLFANGFRWLQFDACHNEEVWADLVLNPSPTAIECNYESRKVRQETKLLLGPSYIPLRREFLQKLGPKSIPRTGQQILLSFGGGDDRGALPLSIDVIKKLDIDLNVTILLTSGNPNGEDILQRVKESKQAKFLIIQDAKDIAEIMHNMDLAVIAGGTTSFETAALGIPSLIISIAKNQIPIAKAWHDLGVSINLGPIESIEPDELTNSLVNLISNKPCREKMSSKGMELVDGLGANRIVDHIFGRLDQRREA